MDETIGRGWQIDLGGLHRIRVRNVFAPCRRSQRADLDRRSAHQREQRRQLLRPRQRLIPLQIDVNVGGNALRHFMDALGAAAVLG